MLDSSALTIPSSRGAGVGMATARNPSLMQNPAPNQGLMPNPSVNFCLQVSFGVFACRLSWNIYTSFRFGINHIVTVMVIFVKANLNCDDPYDHFDDNSINTVEPRSNGTAFNRILPITDTIFLFS